MHIRRGDTVVLLIGKDHGKKGKVTRVLTRSRRIVVEGVNLALKNVRPRRDRQKGERVRFAAPIDASNVQLICPQCSKPTRVRSGVEAGKKQRICRRCQSVIRTK